jgi:sulfonate transport system substrate-binding protein
MPTAFPTIKSAERRRRAVLGALASLLAARWLPVRARGEPASLRIGYQKSSTLLTILKTRGVLDRLLAPLAVTVSWHEFPSGLPLLEALNIGGIDLSADVADTVPVFAQAAGAKLTYFAQEAPSPQAQAIVVRADSPLRGVADLKGKKVAVTKAAGSHYLLIAALARAGLKFGDISAAYLTPADGRAAFERGSVDAWVTWDPYLAGVQRQSQVRVLADGRGIAGYQRYYVVSTPYAQTHGAVLDIVFEQLRKTGFMGQAVSAAGGGLAGAGVGARCGNDHAGEQSSQLRGAGRDGRFAGGAAADRRCILQRGLAAPSNRCGGRSTLERRRTLMFDDYALAALRRRAIKPIRPRPPSIMP